ncbi:MAG: DegT/DnrJ/EryC1/StrS family aminotransferase [Oscillospiraceae bacterium]
MKTPLHAALDTYINNDYARFHIPGHKGSDIFKEHNLAKFDVTEVLGTDSLYESKEAILRTEQAYSDLYATVKSCISAGGSTLCIQTMIALVAKKGGKLICGRTIHSSAVYAMALLDITPIWVYPKDNDCLGVGGRLLLEDIRQAVLENPCALGVYLTSPDYFGAISDIKSIATLCKEHNMPLLVDNAHGAHLHFLQPSLHPIHLGATMCCDSLHKTLPVLTGGAMLHINDQEFSTYAKTRMEILVSTRPIYIIIISIDIALNKLKNHIQTDLVALCEIVSTILNLAEKKGFSILSGEQDPTRISLGFSNMGYTKQTFENHLKKHKIEPEYVSNHFCVLVPSSCTSKADFQRVITMIKDCKQTKNSPISPTFLTKPAVAIPMKVAIFSQSISIKVENAYDKIASAMLNPCPPGVPLLMPGEVIDSSMIQLLKKYGIKELFVVE